MAPAVRAAIRKVAAWPATTSADASAMPEPRPPGEQPVADVAGRCAPDPRPPATDRRRVAPGPRARRRAPPRRPRSRPAAWTSCTGDGSTSRTTTVRTDLHDLPGGALPRDGPQPAADIAHVATVADAAVDVADDPAGQRDVEEQRPVVRRHRSGQRQVDAETAGDDLPPPGAAHGGQHGEACRCRQRPAVDRADAVEERARAQAPDENGERRRGAREAGPRPYGPAHPGARSARGCCRRVAPAGPSPNGSRPGTTLARGAPLIGLDGGRRGRTSRSAWSTVTASCPAAASARRRRA